MADTLAFRNKWQHKKLRPPTCRPPIPFFLLVNTAPCRPPFVCPPLPHRRSPARWRPVGGGRRATGGRLGGAARSAGGRRGARPAGERRGRAAGGEIQSGAPLTPPPRCHFLNEGRPFSGQKSVVVESASIVVHGTETTRRPLAPPHAASGRHVGRETRVRRSTGFNGGRGGRCHQLSSQL